MGITIARIEKRYEESINVSYNDFNVITEFLKDIDSDEYPINFMERGDYYLEFLASEFNRYCEETGIENIPVQIKWLYEEITKPSNLPNEEYIELEWW